MPVNQKIMDKLKEEYGDKHGEEVYYAMENAGKIPGAKADRQPKYKVGDVIKPATAEDWESGTVMKVGIGKDGEPYYIVKTDKGLATDIFESEIEEGTKAGEKSDLTLEDNLQHIKCPNCRDANARMSIDGPHKGQAECPYCHYEWTKKAGPTDQMKQLAKRTISSKAALAKAWKAAKAGQLSEYMQKAGTPPNREVAYIATHNLVTGKREKAGKYCPHCGKAEHGAAKSVPDWVYDQMMEYSVKFNGNAQKVYDALLRNAGVQEALTNKYITERDLRTEINNAMGGKKAGVAQLPPDMTKRVEGAPPMSRRSKLAAAWKKTKAKDGNSANIAYIATHNLVTGKREKSSPEFDKERKEHPEFSEEQIKQIVQDHQRVGKEDAELEHGKMPQELAVRHDVGMKEYAEIEARFTTPGDWHTNGIAHHYSPEVISRAKDTFKGKPFFIGHNEQSGMEYGVINDVEQKVIDGQEWLVAKVRVPETGFAKAALERMENGLVKYVSTFHTIRVDQDRNVTRMTGKALATCMEPEVDGAQITSVTRHIKAA